MNENNNEQEQPLYKEQPWWVQIFVALYVCYVLADDDLCCRAEQPVHWQNRY